MIWPLVPNWSAGVKETLEFKTEVLTSRDGTEQRRALRSTPRRNFEFQSIANDEQLRIVEGLLTNRQADELLLANVIRGVTTIGALPISGTTVQLASVPVWLTEGAAVVMSHRRQTRLFTVDAVVGTTVTFDAPADLAFPAGALLSPTLAGRLAQTMRMSRLTDSVATFDVNFSVTPASDALDAHEPDFSVWYRGYEVFVLKPNWRVTPQIDYDRQTETVDYGRGRIATITPVEYGNRVHTATYLNRTRREAELNVQFFKRMRGRRNEFYAPTWLNDMKIAAPIVVAGTTLTVAGQRIATDFDGDPTRRAIMVQTRLGHTYYRYVNSVAVVGANSVLSLDLDWPFDIPMADVTMISWMPLCRFGSDTLVIEWLTNEIAQMVMSTRTVESKPAEIEPSLLTEGDIYLIESYGWAFTDEWFSDPLQQAVNILYPETGEAD